MSQLVRSPKQPINRHGLQVVDSSQLEAINSYEQGLGSQGRYMLARVGISL